MVAQEFVCAGLKDMDIVSEPGEINDPSFFCSKAEDLDLINDPHLLTHLCIKGRKKKDFRSSVKCPFLDLF